MVGRLLGEVSGRRLNGALGMERVEEGTRQQPVGHRPAPLRTVLVTAADDAVSLAGFSPLSTPGAIGPHRGRATVAGRARRSRPPEEVVRSLVVPTPDPSRVR